MFYYRFEKILKWTFVTSSTSFVSIWIYFFMAIDKKMGNERKKLHQGEKIEFEKLNDDDLAW